MEKMNLGRIESVPVREVWKHEAQDFTKWLAREENLSMLGEACGLDLELVDTESAVGSFAVDIFAQESGTGRKVVIENQLEDTNHDHLGKIITYAAGKNADAVIWIVARARDEHRQAIEWLNSHTDDDCSFFLVEIEAWRIGDSPVAPRFNVVESPNEWARAEKAIRPHADQAPPAGVLAGVPRGGARRCGVLQDDEAPEGPAPALDHRPHRLVPLPPRAPDPRSAAQDRHRALHPRRQGLRKGCLRTSGRV